MGDAMRTRLSICRSKARYLSAAEALDFARSKCLVQRAYACDRCFGWHLTSRTKGRRVPTWERLREGGPEA